jgi:hypothetical protein
MSANHSANPVKNIRDLLYMLKPMAGESGQSSTKDVAATNARIEHLKRAAGGGIVPTMQADNGRPLVGSPTTLRKRDTPLRCTVIECCRCRRLLT